MEKSNNAVHFYLAKDDSFEACSITYLLRFDKNELSLLVIFCTFVAANGKI